MKIRRFLAATAVGVSLAFGGTVVGADIVSAAPSANTAPSVLAGQFCKKADLGKVVTASNGATVKCTNQGQYDRWVVK